MNNKIETISTEQLTKINGGNGQPPASYNGQDLANGARGAATGARLGGLPGGIIGFGAGFMARNVGELGKGIGDLWSESRRGAQLDAQRRQMQQKK